MNQICAKDKDYFFFKVRNSGFNWLDWYPYKNIFVTAGPIGITFRMGLLIGPYLSVLEAGDTSLPRIITIRKKLNKTNLSFSFKT